MLLAVTPRLMVRSGVLSVYGCLYTRPCQNQFRSGVKVFWPNADTSFSKILHYDTDYSLLSYF